MTGGFELVVPHVEAAPRLVNQAVWGMRSARGSEAKLRFSTYGKVLTATGDPGTMPGDRSGFHTRLSITW